MGFHYFIIYVIRHDSDFFYVIELKNNGVMLTWKKKHFFSNSFAASSISTEVFNLKQKKNKFLYFLHKNI